MEATKCKICGERHWGIECGVALRKAKPATEQPVLTVVPKHRLIKAAEEAAEIAKKPFDRLAYQKAYMRDYMRKKRAKDKEKKP